MERVELPTLPCFKTVPLLAMGVNASGVGGDKEELTCWWRRRRRRRFWAGRPELHDEDLKLLSGGICLRTALSV